MLSNKLHQIKIKLEICNTFIFICFFHYDKQEVEKCVVNFFFLLYMLIYVGWFIKDGQNLKGDKAHHKD